MKIALINPSRFYYSESMNVSLNLPLGLLYLGAVLEQVGYEVFVLDCMIHPETKITKIGDKTFHGLSDEVIVQVLLDEAPDIVGITCPFTAQLDSFLRTASLVKSTLPNAFVVAGGAHFSVVPSEFLIEYPYVDSYVLAEGEKVVVEMVRALAQKKMLNDIRGIAFKVKGADGKISVHETKAERVSDMDNLPFPAYHLLDMDLFFEYQQELEYRGHKGTGRAISMITSRGCPFDCSFCSIHLHMGKDVRAHASDYVLKHIRHVYDAYGVRHIHFEDDNLTYKPSRIKEVFETLVEWDLDLTWDTPNGVRVDTLNQELLEIIKKAKCTSLTFGIESGDQETLNNIIKKNLQLKHAVNASRWCKQVGLSTNAFYVIGFPGETKEKIAKTIDFALSLYKQYDVMPQLMVATPLIGTDLYDTVVENSYLVEDLTPESLSKATQAVEGRYLIQTPEFSVGDLRNFSQQLYKQMVRLKLKKALLNPMKNMDLLLDVLDFNKIFGRIRRLLSS